MLANLVALLAFAPAAIAEPVNPQGLRIGLEPQGGLTVSKTFPGFEDADKKVTVTILDLPARAYEEIERAAFSKNQNNMTILKRESFPFDSGVGFLVTGQSPADGVPAHKWFFLATPFLGDGKDITALINVEVPDAARAAYPDEMIRKMLASVSFRPPPMQEQLAQLPFKLNELSGFRIMQILPGAGVILTDGPTDDLTKQPYIIVTVRRGAPGETDERGKFARELLSTAPLRNIAVTLAEPMRITGGPGYEVRAQAVGLDGAPVALVQWLRFGGDAFLRVVAVTAKDNWDAQFTRFRAVRDGVEAK
jgi:hypothetical protein